MNTEKPHERTFIRHPLDMPIEVRPTSGPQETGALINLSLGGLAFQSRAPYPTGYDVELHICCCDPPASVTGRVAWCEPEGNLYDIGVAFHNPADAYKMRMVEQACHIQQYRLDRVIEEGRYMTLDEAAREWISKYARRFTDVPLPARGEQETSGHGAKHG